MKKLTEEKVRFMKLAGIPLNEGDSFSVPKASKIPKLAAHIPAFLIVREENMPRAFNVLLEMFGYKHIGSLGDHIDKISKSAYDGFYIDENEDEDDAAHMFRDFSIWALPTSNAVEQAIDWVNKNPGNFIDYN